MAHLAAPGVVEDIPGRSCPSGYRYGPQALSGPALMQVDCLWVAGGLYGNPFALEALMEAYERERGDKALVFNGDFHWFDVDPEDFEAINDTVLAFDATRGNVETELAQPGSGAGCGCGYPEWVDDATVARSNRIMERLRAATQSLPDALRRLAALPMHLRVDVSGVRVGIVHGDAESLAGWGFSHEALASQAGYQSACRASELANVDVFASSHTCLPVLKRLNDDNVLINNGAAGMPNFKDQLYGLATRISVSPRNEALYAIRIGGVFIEAVPLRYNAKAWESRFLHHWPAGTAAHQSYYRRIVQGPDYPTNQALANR